VAVLRSNFKNRSNKFKYLGRNTVFYHFKLSTSSSATFVAIVQASDLGITGTASSRGADPTAPELLRRIAADATFTGSSSYSRVI